MSTIGVKAIKYPDGDSAINITDGGNVTLAGTLGVTGAITGTLATAAQPNITSVGTLTSFRSTGIDDNADALAITITSAEKVGLGIDPSTLPSFISHAMKIVNGGGLSITSPSSSDNRYIFFGTGTSSSDVQLAAIKNSSSEIMFLGAAGAERMRIASSGHVGVGTTAPTSPLHVVSGEIGNGSNKGIKIANHNASKAYSIRTGITGSENTSFSIHDDTAGVNRLIINTLGRVGIGTGNPAEKLRVQSDDGTDINIASAVVNRALMLKNATAGANNCVSIAMSTETNGEVYLTAVQNSGNDAADFVISTRDSGARAERLRIKSDGAITMPSQPAFLVGMSSNSAQFGPGQFTPTMDTEIFDQGADFSSNTFTAPVTGRYYLSWIVYAGNLDAQASYYYLKLYTSNREYTKYLYTSSFDTDVAYYGWHTSVLADMDAGDTATFHIGQVNGHSTTLVYASNTYASGALIC